MMDAWHHNPSGASPYAAQPLDTNRRSFLMALGAGAAGAAAAAPVLAAPAAIVEATQAKPESQGYRETEHVSTYYATTRF